MSDFYLNERIMQLSVEEVHRQVYLRRLHKECRKGRASWLATQRTQALNRLGRLLVSSGQQLLRWISPAPSNREVADFGGLRGTREGSVPTTQ